MSIMKVILVVVTLIMSFNSCRASLAAKRYDEHNLGEKSIVKSRFNLQMSFLNLWKCLANDDSEALRVRRRTNLDDQIERIKELLKIKSKSAERVKESKENDALLRKKNKKMTTTEANIEGTKKVCRDSDEKACKEFKPLCPLIVTTAYWKCRKTCGMCGKDKVKAKSESLFIHSEMGMGQVWWLLRWAMMVGNFFFFRKKFYAKVESLILFTFLWGYPSQ